MKYAFELSSLYYSTFLFACQVIPVAKCIPLCYNIHMSNFLSQLNACKICPLECGTNRLTGKGACGAQGLAIAKYYLHAFEEPCISFKNGSGTIFFTGCNLRCPYCQNMEVSRAQRGKNITVNELCDIFRELEDMGAENVSLVTPTHLVPYLCEALSRYKPKIPVVYNSSGYEKVETLALIDNFIDIYLPDFKFYSPALSKRYLGREDYFEYASEAIKFMAKKPLVITNEGKMLSGLIVRHLVMPLCSADSKAIIKWFARELPPSAYLSLMSQYTPMGEADKYPELQRKITAREYDTAVQTAFDCGIQNLFLQERSSAQKSYVPVWDF